MQAQFKRTELGQAIISAAGTYWNYTNRRRNGIVHLKWIDHSSFSERKQMISRLEECLKAAGVDGKVSYRSNSRRWEMNSVNIHLPASAFENSPSTIKSAKVKPEPGFTASLTSSEKNAIKKALGLMFWYDSNYVDVINHVLLIKDNTLKVARWEKGLSCIINNRFCAVEQPNLCVAVCRAFLLYLKRTEGWGEE